MSSKAKIWLLLLCLLSSQAFAASVTWIDGQIPPGDWTVDPNSPGTSDTITFSGPLDFIYGSSCSARGSLGGTPQITVDTVNKEVLLWFQGPAPTVCPPVWQPVSGLQGDFGPLAPGLWTFKCTVPAIAFEVSFMVGTPASTFYVDQDSPGPVHNGTNWYWAFSTIQDALAIATPGDTILVAEGVYKPDQGVGVTPGDRSASFTLQDGIILIGGHAGYGALSPDSYDPASYVTELTGDLAGNDQYGLLNTEENSYHIITAEGPGALGILINGVVIKNGRANGNSPDHMGGGLLIQDATAIVSNCLFFGNKGAMGGAIAINQGSLTVVNSRISGNTALLYGGGLYALDGSVDLANCLITGNTGGQAQSMTGSVLYGLNSNVVINSSTITGNIPEDMQAIASLSWNYPPTNELIVNNSILFNGGNEVFTTHPSTTTVASTNIQGGWSGIGTNNVNADPLFVTPGGWSFEGEWIPGNYHLQNGSPCIDQGSAVLLPLDVTDLDVNANTTEPLPLDLDYVARVQGPETDMGVYETEATVAPPVDADWNVANTYNITDTPTSPWTDVQRTVSFTVGVRIQAPAGDPDPLNYLEELGLSVSATSAAGGDWTATFDPDPGSLAPGFYSITIKVVGNHVDLSQVDMGVKLTLAKVQLLWREFQP